jgi:hypothetical protein
MWLPSIAVRDQRNEVVFLSCAGHKSRLPAWMKVRIATDFDRGGRRVLGCR